MKKKSVSESSRKASHGRGERVSTKAVSAEKYQRIKLGIDVHARSVTVVRQLDDSTPQPAQNFTPEDFLEFAARQLKLAGEVHSCHEAGPFGFGLHRKLTALGIKDLVVCPQDWDERNKRVKTDRLDALALCQRLDRYVAGNRRAFAVVRAPSLEQEVHRSRVRQREAFKRELNRTAARGRSLLLNYGVRVSGSWWRPASSAAALERLHEAMCEQWAAEHQGQIESDAIEPLYQELADILEDYRQLAQSLEQKLESLTKLLKAGPEGEDAVAAPACPAGQDQAIPTAAATTPAGATTVAPKPPVLFKGCGVLTARKLAAEVCDWNRFSNRRQVASYTGLCPGVHGTGGHFRQGSINKHGNPRVRAELIELAWRVSWYQPQYGPVLKWKTVLAKKSGTAARKRAIVAIARRLAIDLWRINTGRADVRQLKLAA